MRWIDPGSRGEIALRTSAFVQQLSHAVPEGRSRGIRVLVTPRTDHPKANVSNDLANLQADRNRSRQTGDHRRVNGETIRTSSPKQDRRALTMHCAWLGSVDEDVMEHAEGCASCMRVHSAVSVRLQRPLQG